VSPRTDLAAELEESLLKLLDLFAVFLCRRLLLLKR